ncbi:uncharacterized protein F5891DRAFT_1245792 [Suillus fuscotomentosus]|uniref:Uncharacterized protein n=1 Tax=Suillus fuscotomentosus TaxID=1912939 RepID=A0AAD4HHL3_9AGAM|nr:uncharacterized protein F5891DRAFT_1245792 [Suillus fuscotomentosus]KAG1896787.1 hypothetical protein F5891DRAFT_1245792 [Suillus fuscotomentosus]
MSEFPTDVPGLFTSETILDVPVAVWKRILLGSDFPSRCALEGLTFCKARKRKQHEFIVLYFRHWNVLVPATAVMVVDRAAKTSSKKNGYSAPIAHSSGIISPAALQTLAFDSVSQVITPIKDTQAEIRKCLRERYGKYKELCNHTFSDNSARPSATQISVLLSVISQHAPNYNLYRFQCYWFAMTIWEATKQLYPDSEDTEAPWKGKHSRWHGIKMDSADSVDAVCEKYAMEWKLFEKEAERKKQAEHDRMQEMCGQVLTEKQAEIDRLQAEVARLRSDARSPKVTFEYH